MNRRWFAGRVTAAAVICFVPIAASGQTRDQRGSGPASSWTLPRALDGHPDLQGYWTTQTFTPLEQPEHLAGKGFFTEEEVAALQ